MSFKVIQGESHRFLRGTVSWMTDLLARIFFFLVDRFLCQHNMVTVLGIWIHPSHVKGQMLQPEDKYKIRALEFSCEFKARNRG